MTLHPLRRYFKARKGKPELELKFYPEGGNLITGTDCNVALELNTEEGNIWKTWNLTYSTHKERR